MTAPSSSTTGETELNRLERESLRRRFDAFSPRDLARLAALPAWTAGLGVKLGQAWRWTADRVAELVSDLAAADLIESRQVLEDDGHPTEAFWLRPAIRPELGRYLQDSGQKPLDQVLDELAAAVAHLPLVPATAGAVSSADWLTIVRQYRPDRSGQALVAEVDRRIADGRPAQASALVAAARQLGELASGTLLDAARWAQWRIDGATRVERDRQRLEHYINYPEVEQAIEDLMTGPDDSWALHLLGAGGVGKTTLIRCLASGRFAEEHPEAPAFLVTRVDFDHLDPRYPYQRPAQLLLALGAELEAFVTTRELDQLYRAFQDASSLVHERLAGQHPGEGEADLREAVNRFARFLTALPSPVLFVLDTCEELAKLYTPQTAAPAIDETFRLLDLVQRRAPSTRVLFAGRRWLVPADDPNRKASGPLLQPRGYLRVLRVDGFSATQADRYIDRRENGRLRPALRRAILHRSRTSAEPPDQPSYSPFELAAYCDWVASDPDLDAELLLSAPGDPYVEWRIIGKLGDASVRTALGIAAELGYFDYALVAAALGRAGLDAAHVFDRLAAQEWVNVLSVGADGRPAVIEVDEHLRERIRKVTALRPDLYPVDRARLGEDARQVITSTPLAEVPAETVTAAVLLLPVEEAARLWQWIDKEIAAQRYWGWSDQVAVRVRGAEQERLAGQPAGTPTIMAAVIASQACARLQAGPGPDVALLWRDVAVQALRYPDEGGRYVLRLRAGLGQLAVGDVSDTSALAEALAADAAVREALTGAIVAAFMGRIGRGENLPGELPRLIEDFGATTGDPVAKAAAQAVLAVLALWAGDTDQSTVRRADSAISWARRAAAHDRPPWPDWARPRRFDDHCRLIRMIIAWRGGEPIDGVRWREWRTSALEHLDDIDSERLAAATVMFEFGHRLIEGDELIRIGGAERYFPGRRPTTWAHRQVGPLILELAQAWQARGVPLASARQLRQRTDEAVYFGEDPDTIEQCELGLLKLCRRERDSTLSSAVRRLSMEGSPRQRREAWLVRTLVDGERPKSPREAGSWSTWWQCQDASVRLPLPEPIAATPADRAELSEIFPEYALPPLPDADIAVSRDFDPVDELRLGRQVMLSPAALGRAAVEAAEVTALRVPELAADQLIAVTQQLKAAGDELARCEAILLAGLASARAGKYARARNLRPSQYVSRSAYSQFATRPGWKARADALDSYLRQRPLPESLPASPELRLPVRLSWRRRLLSRLVGATTTLTLPFTAIVFVVTAIVATVFSGIRPLPNFALDIVWSEAALLALLAVARAVGGFVPYQFGAARALKVTRDPTGRLVEVRAVTSRGMLDLTGLTLRTLAGAITGRWPARSMFSPWKGTWEQSLSTDAWPAFDVRGLHLPMRTRPPRLTTIEILTDDETSQELAWEQWLGAGQSDTDAANLIWFRHVPGQPVRHPWRRWRRYGALYQGPAHLAPDQPPHPRWADVYAIRVLHIVSTPVLTSAGWRLRVSEGARGGTPRENLRRVDLSPFHQTAVAVLQADPVDPPPRSLRDQRQAFTRCALDLLDGGADAVLVIPPLPDDVGAEVVRTVWRDIATKRTAPSPMTLLRTTGKIKRIIAAASAKAPAPDGTDFDSAVLDVLLFLRTPRQPYDRPSEGKATNGQKPSEPAVGPDNPLV